MPTTSPYRIESLNTLWRPPQALSRDPDVPLSVLAMFAIRTGRLATAQLPLLYVLAGRKNPVSLLTGVSYQTVRYYHKLVAVAVTAETVAHTGAYMMWFVRRSGWAWMVRFMCGQSYLIWGVSPAHPYPLSKDPPMNTGADMYCAPSQTVGTVGSLVASVWYYRPIRLLSYEVFLASHILGALAFLLGCYLHEMPNMWNWCYAAFALWALERALRLPAFFGSGSPSRTGCRWRRGAHIEAEARVVSGAILLSVPFSGAWHGGEHFYISFWGWGKWWWMRPWLYGQTHPMTVANSSAEGTGKVEFVIKVHKGITRSLARYIVNKGLLDGVKLSVTLEGPYGERPETEAWEGVLLVGGGSGVTFPWSVLHEVVHAQEKESRGRRRDIKFVWAMHHLSKSNLVFARGELASSSPSADNDVRTRRRPSRLARRDRHLP